jgi:nucleotide-binding universal stress UspA family protein
MTEETARASGSVVVGIDDSEGARHALRWAAAEAKLRGAALRVVHAWSSPVPLVAASAVEIDDAPYEAQARSLVDDALQTAELGTGAIGIARRGFAPDVLLDEARSSDVLVVGSRGRGGFRSLLLGSVSQTCATAATGPVIVDPAGAIEPNDADVVVGVDGSDGSRVALAWALEEAVRRRARLVVVHAWWTPYAVPPTGFAVAPVDPKAFLDESRQLLHECYDGIADRATQRPVAVELLPIEEPAGRALVERATGAGLIVVGSRGRGGVAGLLLGSVSQQCLHHATCAVAVIPTQ